MYKLIKKIEKLTPNNTQKSIDTITNMICTDVMQAKLNEEHLLQALSIKGEYLVLQMSYEDFEKEIHEQKIKYKISQALSVIVCYEDDGSSLNNITEFIEYISSLVDPKQNSIFGIKKVNKLSQTPVTILFSGILPINQLKVHISKDIYNMIHSDEIYFKSRFKEFRNILSQEIGTPILPVFPMLDDSLSPTEARLIDLVDGKVISQFCSAEEMNRVSIESYLVKLFYIYITLANKEKSQHNI
jgi:hypothetical protein